MDIGEGGMINLDYKIERISNGIIVTGNDSTKQKRYFSSIRDFLESYLLEQVRELDRDLVEHNSCGCEFEFKAHFAELEN